MDLYHRICRRLHYWVFPEPWPTKPPEILNFAHKAALEFLPYLVALNNLVRFRNDLRHTGFKYKYDEEFQWVTNNLHTLTKRIKDWLYKMPRPGQLYYAMYNPTNNRLANTWEFTPEAMIENFGLNNSNHDDITYMRVFAYYIGNPLATVEQREIKSKLAHALCIPKEVLVYGI